MDRRYRYHANDRVGWVLIDNVHRLTWVLVAKSGTRSWLKYFAETVGETRYIVSYRRDFANMGLNLTNYIPVSELNARYRNYTNLIVVRHPLQRFVSAYYDVVVKRRVYTGLCETIRSRFSSRSPSSCSDDPVLSFEEFSQGLAADRLPRNQHWETVQSTARPCQLDTYLIFKSETANKDVIDLNRMLGLSHATLSHVHSRGLGHNEELQEKNHTVVGLTQYDPLLRSLQWEHPSTFQWLLQHFHADMKMFGYTWNTSSGSSGCICTGCYDC